MKFCYFYVSCAGSEADKLSTTLLENHLVACVKKVPVDSAYWWKNKIENDTEVLLVMESAEEMFEKVEALLKEVHSYDTYVLTAVPMVKVSADAQKWLEENLK